MKKRKEYTDDPDMRLLRYYSQSHRGQREPHRRLMRKEEEESREAGVWSRSQ